jgi:hypothetical protein
VSDERPKPINPYVAVLVVLLCAVVLGVAAYYNH